MAIRHVLISLQLALTSKFLIKHCYVTVARALQTSKLEATTNIVPNFLCSIDSYKVNTGLVLSRDSQNV